MDAKAFGSFIAANRKELHMTQVDLAAKLNVTDKAISRWERGLGFPDINTIEPLAAALGLTVLELMRSEKSSDKEEMTNNDISEIMNSAADMTLENIKIQNTNLTVLSVVAGIVIVLLLIPRQFHWWQIIFPLVGLAVMIVCTYYAHRSHDRSGNRKIYTVTGYLACFITVLSGIRLLPDAFAESHAYWCSLIVIFIEISAMFVGFHHILTQYQGTIRNNIIYIILYLFLLISILHGFYRNVTVNESRIKTQAAEEYAKEQLLHDFNIGENQIHETSSYIHSYFLLPFENIYCVGFSYSAQDGGQAEEYGYEMSVDDILHVSVKRQGKDLGEEIMENDDFPEE